MALRRRRQDARQYMRKTRIALIGLGMAVTPHAKSLVDLGDRLEVAHAFSPSEARRRAFGAKFPFPLSTRIEDILEDDSVTAALVLTPPNTHFEVASRLAAAGKHVLLEKPLEVSTARALELVEVFEACGCTLAVVLQHRFRPGALRLAQIVADGALGDIAAATVSVPWWRPQAYYDEPGRGTLARDGGGVLMTQAIHTLDLFLSLTGPVSRVSALGGTSRLHRMQTEDIVGAGLEFANGAFGALWASTASYPGFAERIELIGTRGTALLSAGKLDIAWQDGRREELGEQGAAGGGADPMDFPHDAHRSVLADFLDAVETGRAPRASGREALKVQHFIDALLDSAQSGRAAIVPV
jgi:predicted dehydrogenase